MTTKNVHKYYLPRISGENETILQIRVPMVQYYLFHFIYSLHRLPRPWTTPSGWCQEILLNEGGTGPVGETTTEAVVPMYSSVNFKVRYHLFPSSGGEGTALQDSGKITDEKSIKWALLNIPANFSFYKAKEKTLVYREVLRPICNASINVLRCRFCAVKETLQNFIRSLMCAFKGYKIFGNSKCIYGRGREPCTCKLTPQSLMRSRLSKVILWRIQKKL